MAYADVDSLRHYLDQVADLGIQKVTIAGATGGTFALSYEGTATGALAYNATATTVQTALQAIVAIGTLVKVTGPPGAYLITFQGTLSTDAGPLSADGALLTGTTPTITVESATEDVLSSVLDRATDIVRAAMRALLADPLFDYTSYGAASTQLVRGYDSEDLRIPVHQAGSVILVETETGSSPLSYTEMDAAQWDEEGVYLHRSGGWTGGTRYRITAVWGHGPTASSAIEEVTLEVAANIYRSRATGGFIDTLGQDGASSVRVVAGLTKLQQATLQNIASTMIGYGV